MWRSTGGAELELENVSDVKSTAMVLLLIYSCKCWLHSISSILQILKSPGGEPEREDVIKYSLVKVILTKWASKGTWQHVQIVLGKSSRWQAPRKMLEGEEVISPSALTQQEVPSVTQGGQALCLHTFSLNTVRGLVILKHFHLPLWSFGMAAVKTKATFKVQMKPPIMMVSEEMGSWHTTD